MVEPQRRIPAAPTTSYSIGSVAKPFTSTGPMVLAQRGVGLVLLDHLSDRD
jgi:CubicO group peptidase (beta-lactamase class C family)